MQAMHRLPGQPSGIQIAIFKIKSEKLLTFLISAGIIFPVIGAQYLSDRKP